LQEVPVENAMAVAVAVAVLFVERKQECMQQTAEINTLETD
jgi:hypothetical protein